MSVGKALGGGVPVGAALVSRARRADDLARRSRQHLRRQPAGARAARVLPRPADRTGCSITCATVGAHFERRLRAARAATPGHRRGARRRPHAGARARTSTRRRSSSRRSSAGLLVNRTAETVVRLLPPLDVEAAEIDGPWTFSMSVLAAVPSEVTRVSVATAVAASVAGIRRTRRRRRRDADVRAARGGAMPPAIHALIVEHLERAACCRATLDELRDARASLRRRDRTTARVVGCAELAPLSETVAEVRSLVVIARNARGWAIGLRHARRARCAAPRRPIRQLCAFTHAPVVLRAAGLLDRAARLAAGEDRRRLPRVPAVPTLRPVRGRSVAAASDATTTRVPAGGTLHG